MQFNKELQNIATYEAGKPIEEVVRKFGLKESDVIKLASNENPYGTSPRVVESIKANAHKAALYPDDSMFALKAGLEKHFGVPQKQCIIGSGSDQIIELCIHAKANASSAVLMAGVTFAMYEIYAKQVGAKIIRTPSNDHKIEEFLACFKEHKPSIIFLCVPNNPLGECLKRDEVYSFLEYVEKESGGETLVVIDGTYQEFAAFKDSARYIEPKDVITRFKNVAYLGTFSKAYGLGGMRVGYGFGSEEIISALYKLRAPFNITTLSLAAACAALEDMEFVRHTIEQNFIQMRRYEQFAESKNIAYIPSFTNFITLVLDESTENTPKNIQDAKNTSKKVAELLDSSAVCDKLLRQGVIIRNLASYKMNAMRITIGTEAQNTRVLGLLESIFGSEI
ncbi:histidinol-phosphate transaminase [Helicobacter sp. CLO-3]|uniref:histidinol-phosphate transaminase n=1 Tax=unclassified Helicobacter TaxID=2593540 RepID=UPI000805C08F|nr:MULTISPECIES: histidinol-phosphate transaminase [unclassified Helicobacter]OBV29990.1 histidinol-phosphate transaminase [Helicobacter sp. CLO-3]OHU83189.1 histidinol-phosphate transaminase [Helicobacter sp. CLO-3]